MGLWELESLRSTFFARDRRATPLAAVDPSGGSTGTSVEGLAAISAHMFVLPFPIHVAALSLASVAVSSGH